MKKLIILISMILVVSTPCFAQITVLIDTTQDNSYQKADANILVNYGNAEKSSTVISALPRLGVFCMSYQAKRHAPYEVGVLGAVKDTSPWCILEITTDTNKEDIKNWCKDKWYPHCLVQLGGTIESFEEYELLRNVSFFASKQSDTKFSNLPNEEWYEYPSKDQVFKHGIKGICYKNAGWNPFVDGKKIDQNDNPPAPNITSDFSLWDWDKFLIAVNGNSLVTGNTEWQQPMFNQVKNYRYFQVKNGLVDFKDLIDDNIFISVAKMIGNKSLKLNGWMNNKLKEVNINNETKLILQHILDNNEDVKSISKYNVITSQYYNLETNYPSEDYKKLSYKVNAYPSEVVLDMTLDKNKSSTQLFEVNGKYTDDNPYNIFTFRNIVYKDKLMQGDNNVEVEYNFGNEKVVLKGILGEETNALFKLNEKDFNERLPLYYGLCRTYGIGLVIEEVYDKNGNRVNTISSENDNLGKSSADAKKLVDTNIGTVIGTTMEAQFISDTHSIWTLGLALTGCASPIDKDYQAKVVELLPYVKDTIAVRLTNPELNSTTGSVNSTLGEYTKIALALTNYRKVLKLGVDKKTSVSTYNNNCISLGDLLSRDTYALYVDDGYYDIKTDEIIIHQYLDTTEYTKDGKEIPEIASRSSILLKDLYYNNIDNEFLSWLKETYGRSKVTYDMLSQMHSEQLANIAKSSNKILTVDKFGYRTGNIPAFINWLYLNELKNNTMFIANTDLSLPIFCDAYGNIITADNRMILPAISNNLLTTPGTCERVGQVWNTLYQSRAMSNILNYKFEVQPEAYSQLQKFFLVKRLPEDPTTEVYNIYSKFMTEAVNGKYYIYLAPESYVFKENQTDGTVKDLPITYNKALYDNQNSVAKYLEAVLCYITQGDLESVTVDIDDTSHTIDVKSELLKQSKGTFIVCYMANAARVIVYALCGAKDTEINQYIKVCLDKMDFDRLSIAISGILDMFTDLFNTLNFGLFSRIFDGWSDNQLNLIQLIASLLIYFTIICLVISIIVKFNDSNIFKLIMTVVSIVLLLLLPSGLNLISSVVEKTVSQDIIDASLLAELSSEHKGYKQGITKNYEVKSNRLLLGIEEDKFPVFSAFASILSLNSEYTIKDTITKKAGENILNTSSTLIHRNMTSYGLDIVKSIGNIGIRNTSDRAVFTYTEAENVLNFYTLTLPMMSIATKRINNIYKGVINSNVDTRFSEIQDINKTYGLSYYYISRLNYHHDYYKDSTKDGYDYTGLLTLFKDVLTDKNTGDIKDYVIDDSGIDQSQQIGSFDVNSIFDEFSTKETLPYEYALNHKDKLYKACIEANNAYLKALNKLYQSSTSYDDTVIIYFASLKAALAFNKELGLQQNTIVLKNLANDSILVSLLNGTNAALASAGKTSGRYLYDTYQDNSIMLIIYTMVFIFLNVVIIAKNLVIFVILAIFIYSIIKIGINKDNIEGLALNSVLLVSMICITYFTFNTLILVSSNSNSPILNLIVTTVTLIFYLNFLLNLTKGLFEDAISAGKNAVTSLLQPLNSMKDNIKRSVNNKFNGVTPINTNITYNGELNVSKKYNSQTRVTNKIEKLASKYDDKLEIGKLARSIVQGVDNG